MVACADRNYEELNRQGLRVISPGEIGDCGCDVIVVANSFARVRKEIERELTEKYPKKKINVMDETLIHSENALTLFGLND